ncbi:MAG: cytochrome c family protein [Paracoccaceae bacterium]
MYKTISVIFSALIISTTPALAQDTGDATAGENIFRKCAACHQIGVDAKNRVGPVLTNIIDRPAASFEGYRYGRAMQAAGAAGLVWTPENLFAYLAGPKPFLRDLLDDRKAKAKMAFKLPDAQDRLDVIAYLATFQTASMVPVNGFCVQNKSTETHFFAVDAGDNGRELQQLAPGEILCTAEFTTPQNGFVSVFEALETAEGCSRLTGAGTVEGMVQYADFDRCEWSSHEG